MIAPEKLPPQVLVKVATLEANCLRLGERLETARRDLQRLRVERRDCVPREVYDEAGVNEESERVLGEWQRLDDAIATQETRCEAFERRLRGEEAVIRSCKSYLHELPSNARLRVVESRGGDLDAIRARIDAVKGEIAQTQHTPVLSSDLGEKIADHVAALAMKARPIVSGTGDGETLRVLYPLRADGDRVTQSGFAADQVNPLLLIALLQPERLAERLLQCAVVSGITPNERSQRLTSLQAQLTQLRYDEEAAVSNAGFDAVRSSSSPPWAVLMIEVEHEQKQAAA